MGSRLSEVSQRWVGQPRGRLGGLGVLLGLLLAGLVSCKARDEPVKREEPVKPAPSTAATPECPHYGGSQQITIPPGSGTSLVPVRACLTPNGKVTLINRCSTTVSVNIVGWPSPPVFQMAPGESRDQIFPAGNGGNVSIDTIRVVGCDSDTSGDPKTGTVEVSTDPEPK
jgi:hypothetical protein